jgi:hypothetical protein
MRGKALVFSALAALAAAGTAEVAEAQQDLTARAILSYRLFQTDEARSTGFFETFDLKLDRAISDAMRLRLSLRGEGDQGSAENGPVQSSSSYRQLQPGARFEYLLPKVQVVGSYDLYDTKSSTGDVSGTRKLQRSTESLSWSPDALPLLTLAGEQRGTVDNLGGIDQRENLLSETLGYKWNHVGLTQTGRYTTFDAAEQSFTRKTYDGQLLANYENSGLDGRLVATASAVGGFTRLEETAQSATSAPSPVLPVAVFWAQDDTPLEGRDKPLVAIPALSDRDLGTSAGISLGPDGSSYQNLAVDMGRFVALDLFRVTVRDAGKNPVPDGGLVRFDAYTSQDGVAWVPLAAGTRTRFVLALSAYEVDIPSTTARWLKIVSFGTNAFETFVTEVEVFFHTSFGGRETRRTDTRYETGNVAVTAKPFQNVTVSYNGLFNDYGNTRSDGATFENRDLDHLVSVLVTPVKRLDVQARWEKRTVTADAFNQAFTGLWGVATFTTNPNLITTLEASRTDDDSSQHVTTDTLRLHNYARLYKSLDLSLDGGVARGTFAEGVKTSSTFLTATSYVQLTDDVKLTLSANLQTTSTEGDAAGVVGLPPSRDVRYYGEVYYRPGRQLLLSARFGYAGGSFVSGLTQSYRVEWYPFAGGTVGIGTVFDEDISSNGSYRRFRRIQILPHWTINRHAMLDVNYNELSLRDEGLLGTSATESRTKLVTLNLTLTL